MEQQVFKAKSGAFSVIVIDTQDVALLLERTDNRKRFWVTKHEFKAFYQQATA